MRGMWVMIGVAAWVLSGCVWKSSYDDLSTKYDHVKAVKNEQEVERDGLRAEVRAVHQGYGQQAGKLSLVEGTMRQQAQDVATVKTRVSTVKQEVAQQRAELGGIHQKLTEALQAMHTLMEKQGQANLMLDSLTTKVDGLKRPVGGKPMPMHGKSGDPQAKTDSQKGAVERALEQRAKQQAASASATGLIPDSLMGVTPASAPPDLTVFGKSVAEARSGAMAGKDGGSRPETTEEVGKKPTMKGTLSEQDVERFRTLNEQELAKLTAEADAETSKLAKEKAKRGGAENVVRRLLPPRSPTPAGAN